LEKEDGGINNRRIQKEASEEKDILSFVIPSALIHDASSSGWESVDAQLAQKDRSFWRSQIERIFYRLAES